MVRPLANFDHAGADLDERNQLLTELRDEGTRVLSAAGVASKNIRFRYGVDARYLGQGNEITIWVGEGNDWTATIREVVELFETDYRRIYGLTIPDVGVEAVTWRLSAFAAASPVEPRTVVSSTDAAPHHTRPVRYSRGTDPIDTPVYRRTELGLGQRIVGPAIVEERETTAVIRPQWVAHVTADGSLVAEHERLSQ